MSENHDDCQLENIARWNESSACISGIFSQEGNDSECGLVKDSINGRNIKRYHEIEVYPNFVKLRAPGAIDPPGTGGMRGKITEFSGKARNRMIQRMASLVTYPDFWQDFTFPDCVMGGKTVEARSALSSKVLKRFKRRIERCFKGTWGIWRREWEPRRSGSLFGELCPHFHMLLTIPVGNKEDYQRICIIVAMIWVGCIDSEEPLESEWKRKATMVSTHRKSYRWLENHKMAQVYVSKYLAKTAESGQHSKGRYWGKIGCPPIGEPVKVRMTSSEAKIIRRLFRRKVGKRSGRIYGILKNHIANGWLLIMSDTVKNMMSWVKDTLETRAIEGFCQIYSG